MAIDWYTRFKLFFYRLGVLPLSIKSILLIVNLAVLALPLGSIFFFRIYENQLIRETEAKLIVQSVFISEIYKREIREKLKVPGALGTDFEPVAVSDYGRNLELVAAPPDGEYFTPLKPTLDLATDEVLPPRPLSVVPLTEADKTALSAGSAINAILAAAQRTTLAGFRVLDFKGVTVAGGNEITFSLGHVKEIGHALTGRYKSVIRQRISDEPPPKLASLSRGTGIRIFTAYPITEGGRLWGVVYLSRTPPSILKNMYSEKNKIILIGLTVITLALFIALITSWTIARPIYRLIGHTERISSGDVDEDPEFDVPGTKEMALLSKSFSDMTRSLNARTGYIKQFATHVSHEFKTPLTSIKGAAELLDEHGADMKPHERARFLKNIIMDANRMELLTSRLFDLARADSLSPVGEETDLVAALERAAVKYTKDDFRVTCFPSTSCTVGLSREALDVILGNLIDNAERHGAHDVELIAQRAGTEVELLIRNDGECISTANARKIFDPFFTTRRESGGTGLGLSITRSLLLGYGGAIRVEVGAENRQEQTSADTDWEAGAAFTVTLPVVANREPSR